MSELEYLFRNNRQWAARLRGNDPDFFNELAQQQSPDFLWIGCSDSRVPANDIVGLMPGELFVHRNIANLMVHSDINGLSVLQFAVEVLKVRHIIVCGHYGCGGVRAAMQQQPMGLIDNWLRHIRDVYQNNRLELESCSDEESRLDRLCELNVMTQVQHVCETGIVQGAWERGQELSVHGWIYAIQDGHLHDLHLTTRSAARIDPAYRLISETRRAEIEVVKP